MGAGYKGSAEPEVKKLGHRSIQRMNDKTGLDRVLCRGGIQKEFREVDVKSLKVCEICKRQMKF